MREIKFRQWIEKRFIYWDFTEPGKFCGVNTGGKITIQVAQEMSQQFIGLYDKNGKEIYEGDIVYHSYYEEKAEVVFYVPQFAYKLKYDDGKTQELYPIDNYSLEIISNIYENPELRGR